MTGFISRALGVAAALTLLAPSANALQHIVQKGSKFFTADGNQWFVKGVAYQLQAYELGTDAGQCTRDAALMQQLGANSIRVYHVDPSLDHDGCMQAFNDHGIYVFVDLDTFSSTVTQTDPQWTPAQYGAFKFVMDAFQKYDNVAGFFIGNEVLNQVGPMTNCMPYIKAATADMKAYRDAAGYRKIPIGYSHADVAGLRPILQNYLACGDAAQAIDFFGLNAYEWCGDSSFEQSGYAYLLNQTLDYPVPIFMSETGCIVPEPRLFTDQTAIFGQMAGKWSGSIIYEWIQEANHYGLIAYAGSLSAFDYSNNGDVRSGTPQPIVPDFANLQAQWATLNPTGVQMASYQPTDPPMACPAYTAGVWEVDPSAALPTLGLGVAIPTQSALALANLGLSGPFSVPQANALPVTQAPATTAAPSSSAPSTPASSPAPVSSPSSTTPVAIIAPVTTPSSTPASTVVATSTPSSSPSPSPSPSSSSSAVPTSSPVSSVIASATSSAASIRSSIMSSAASAASTQSGIVVAPAAGSSGSVAVIAAASSSVVSELSSASSRASSATSAPGSVVSSASSAPANAVSSATSRASSAAASTTPNAAARVGAGVVGMAGVAGVVAVML